MARFYDLRSGGTMMVINFDLVKMFYAVGDHTEFMFVDGTTFMANQSFQSVIDMLLRKTTPLGD